MKIEALTEKEKFDYLLDRLFKECENSRGYLGVLFRSSLSTRSASNST